MASDELRGEHPLKLILRRYADQSLHSGYLSLILKSSSEMGRRELMT